MRNPDFLLKNVDFIKYNRLDMSLADGFRAEQRGYKWLNTTEDAMIGAAAFAQKETPQWTAKKP